MRFFLALKVVKNMANMSSGGGLSNGKLEMANATPEDVLTGKTFYSGDKGLKTGAIPDYGREPVVNKVAKYNPGNGDNLYLYLPNADTEQEAIGGRIQRAIAAPASVVRNAIGVDGTVVMDRMIQRDWTFSEWFSGYSGFVVIIAKDYGGNDGNGVNQASVSPSSGRVASNIKLYTNDYDDGLYRAVGRVFLILGANSSGTTINGTIYTNQTNFGCHVTIIGIK